MCKDNLSKKSIKPDKLSLSTVLCLLLISLILFPAKRYCEPFNLDKELSQYEKIKHLDFSGNERPSEKIMAMAVGIPHMKYIDDTLSIQEQLQKYYDDFIHYARFEPSALEKDTIQPLSQIVKPEMDIIARDKPRFVTQNLSSEMNPSYDRPDFTYDGLIPDISVLLGPDASLISVPRTDKQGNKKKKEQNAESQSKKEKKKKDEYNLSLAFLGQTMINIPATYYGFRPTPIIDPPVGIGEIRFVNPLIFNPSPNPRLEQTQDVPQPISINPNVYEIPNTYTMKGGSISAKSAYIGIGEQGSDVPASGAFTLRNGNISLSEDLNLGFYSNAHGEFSMEDGNISARNVLVGVYGNGHVEQNGGSIGTADKPIARLSVAVSEGSVGQYNLNDGSIYTNESIIGENGDGTIRQYEGLHIANELIVNNAISSVGNGKGLYELYGGNLITRTSWIEGNFKHYAGNHIIEEVCNAYNYELYGGSLVSELFYGEGNFKHYDGNHIAKEYLACWHYELIAGNLTADHCDIYRGFIQNGGNFVSSGYVWLRDSATYDLYQGSLNILSFYIGGSYSHHLFQYTYFNQYGGENLNDECHLDGRATYFLDKGTHDTNKLSLNGKYQINEGTLNAKVTNIFGGGENFLDTPPPEGTYTHESVWTTCNLLKNGILEETIIGIDHYTDGYFQQNGGIVSTEDLSILGLYELHDGTVNTITTYIDGQSNVGANKIENVFNPDTFEIEEITRSFYGGWDGQLIQFGGTNNTEKLMIYGTGKYLLHNGTLNTQNVILKEGSFIQNGGSHSSQAIFTEEEGCYHLNNGTFTAKNVIAKMNINGGSFETDTYQNTDSFFINSKDAQITINESITFVDGGTFSAVEDSSITLDSASFVIQSTNRTDMAGLNNLTINVEGEINSLEAACADLGAVAEGFVENFSVDAIILNNLAYLILEDNFDNQPDVDSNDAFYVEYLFLGEDSTLDLNGINLYYKELVDEGGNVILDGAEFTQILESGFSGLMETSFGAPIIFSPLSSVPPAPEPSVYFLMMFGGGFLFFSVKSKKNQ